MRPRRIALTLLCAAALAAPARAETRSHLEGDLRPVAPYLPPPEVAVLFNGAGASAGTFTLDAAAPELDFRSAPGVLVLTTAAGSLTAEAVDPPTLYGVLPRDPESGLALKAAAPDGDCPTGTEPDCWVLGDPIPEDEVAKEALLAFQAPQASTASPPAAPSGVYTPSCELFGTCGDRGIDLRPVESSVLLQPWRLLDPYALPGFTATSVRVVDPNSGRPRPASGSRSDIALGPGRSSIRSGGGAQFGRSDFAWGPSVTWNYVLLLAQQSPEFVPNAPASRPQCSFATPQYCSSVQHFFVFYMTLLGDDPLAATTARGIWETGALYAVTAATGALAPYAGGHVHVHGLERARANVARLGIPLVLMPAGATLDPAAPFAAPTPSAPEQPSFGLAYATVPEPASIALALGAVGALVALRLQPRR